MHIEQLEKILQRCKKNDRVAQRELYEAFYRYGLSICSRYINDQENCRELLNDSFMKVFTKFDLYDNLYPFQPWFHKIVVNTCLNHLKKHINEPTHVEIELAFDYKVEQELFEKYSVQELLLLIQQLPVSFRTVFNLFCIEGFSHAEIAQTLGISEGTSFSHLSKARKKLQSIMYLM